MSKEINRIAEHYLHELLQQNPTVEFQKVIPSMRLLRCSEYTDEDAERFVSQIQSVESERIDISLEPTSVNILRMCPRKMPAYLSGFRKDGKAVWSYHQHLATVTSQDKADDLLAILKGYGFECFVLPASEARRGTL